MLGSIKVGVLELCNGLKLFFDPVNDSVHPCLPALLPVKVLLNQILVGVRLALFRELFVLAELLFSHQASQVTDYDLLTLDEGLVDHLLLLPYHTVLNPLSNLLLSLHLDGVIHCFHFAAKGSLKRLSNLDQGVPVSFFGFTQPTEIVVLTLCTLEPNAFNGISSTFIAFSRVFRGLLLYLYFLSLTSLSFNQGLTFTPLLLIQMNTLLHLLLLLLFFHFLHFSIVTLALLCLLRQQLIKLNLDSSIEGV